MGYQMQTHFLDEKFIKRRKKVTIETHQSMYSVWKNHTSQAKIPQLKSTY